MNKNKLRERWGNKTIKSKVRQCGNIAGKNEKHPKVRKSSLKPSDNKTGVADK